MFHLPHILAPNQQGLWDGGLQLKEVQDTNVLWGRVFREAQSQEKKQNQKC